MILLSELSFDGLCLKCKYGRLKFKYNKLNDMNIKIICPFWHVSSHAVFSNDFKECEDFQIMKRKDYRLFFHVKNIIKFLLSFFT